LKGPSAINLVDACLAFSSITAGPVTIRRSGEPVSVVRCNANGDAMTINERIRSLFLASRSTYTIGETAQLLELSWEEVRGWLESGEVEGIETERGLVLPWAEVVFMGMEWWGQDTVEEALGAELARALPELVQLAELRVRLPRYEITAVERAALREGKSVDAVVARELLDFVSAQAGWVGREVPGFAAALAWPGRVEA
jgi:hypothetical protein